MHMEILNSKVSWVWEAGCGETGGLAFLWTKIPIANIHVVLWARCLHPPGHPSGAGAPPPLWRSQGQEELGREALVSPQRLLLLRHNVCGVNV